MLKRPFVYMMTNKRNGTLYVGVTSDLPKRVWQHKTGAFGGFTHRYGCTNLVWFEESSSLEHAILREKQLKKWRRKWKLELIDKTNPEWLDLAEDLGGAA